MVSNSLPGQGRWLLEATKPTTTTTDRPPGWGIRSAPTRMGLLLLAILIAFTIAGVIWSLANPSGFQTKAAVFFGLIGGLAVYLTIRTRQHGVAFFMPGELHEDQLALSGDLSLCDLKSSWEQKASRAAEYSAIALGMVLIGAVLLASATELDGGEQTLFRWTLALSAISAVVYGVSVQLWEEAIGSGYAVEDTLKLRSRALILSTTAWFTLAWALALAVITVDTSLGALAGSSGVVAVVYTAESKHRLARCEDVGAPHPEGGFARHGEGGNSDETGHP